MRPAVAILTPRAICRPVHPESKPIKHQFIIVATRSRSGLCHEECLETLWDFSDYCQLAETLSSVSTSGSKAKLSHVNKHLIQGPLYSRTNYGYYLCVRLCELCERFYRHFWSEAFMIGVTG